MCQVGLTITRTMMGNQYSNNQVLETAAFSAFGEDLKARQNFKSKIYKRLSRRGFGVDTASQVDWEYVLDDENYPEELYASKQVKIGCVIYQSISEACRALNKSEYGRTDEQFEDAMRKRLRRVSQGGKIALTPKQKGVALKVPMTKVMSGVSYNGQLFRSFSAACESLGRKRQGELRRYKVVAARVNITQGEYLCLTQDDYEKVKALPVAEPIVLEYLDGSIYHEDKLVMELECAKTVC